MTTGEFIKMLQREDPDGNTHIRIGGGVPYYAEHKPGYWDGPYSYIDENGNWVETTEGSKIDIYCREPEDIVSDVLHSWNTWKEPKEELWDKVKDKFIFKYTYVHSDDRINSFLDRMKDFLDSMADWTIESHNKYLDEVKRNYKKGWRFYQDQRVETEKKYKFSGWKIETNSKEKGFENWATIGPIILSGEFEPCEPKDGYIEWKLKDDL